MLTLQFVPYHEIEGLSSSSRVEKLLGIAKENKIVLLQGRLRKEEEAHLIRATMEEISREFKGIELSVIYPSTVQNFAGPVGKIKHGMMNLLLGDRQGMTIIGPANYVREIKKDPDKIQLFIEESKVKKKNTWARRR